MKIIFTFFLMSIFLFTFNITMAETVNPCECPDHTILKSGDVPAEECRDLQRNCSGGTPSPNEPVKLTNPLTGTQSSEGIPVLLGKIINSVMGIIGSLALVMFIYGGATWMLSGGNQEQVTRGKNTLIWAAIGLVIIFMAYALVNFVLKAVTNT